MLPKISYLICATPRCGGYLLFESLENTGLAGIPGEYFWDDKKWGEKWGATDYTDFLNKVVEKGTTPNGVFGTKLMWGYFDRFISKVRQTPQFMNSEMTSNEVLNTLYPNLHFIWIMRRDKVRQAISLWKGLQTVVWWKRIGDPEPKLDKEPEYNYEAIDYLAQEIMFHEAAWQEYFSQYSITPFTVIYEDLVLKYEETAFNVMDWLGIDYPDNLKFGERRLLKQADEISEIWVERYIKEKQEQENNRENHSPFPNASWNYGTSHGNN
ncbi:sulfotransferase [Candidatus Poribacteria bacterium]|nr:sulfotransferase [Candidatus Poribacteria bacterium]